MKFIKCPYCGYEYHPSEIFVPRGVFGKPVSIERNEEGKIQDIICDSSDMNETYSCDNCNKTFSVTLDMSFDIQKTDTIDFDTDFVTVLKNDIH